MAFFKAGLNRILRSDHLKRAAALTVLSLFSLIGVFLMAEAFRHNGSSTVTNATNTDSSQSTSASSILDAFHPVASASAGIKATFSRRAHENHGDGEMESIQLDAFGRPAKTPSSTSVTSVNPAKIASWSSTANPRATTTFFKAIFTITTASETSEASEPLPLIDSIPTRMDSFIALLSARVSRLDKEPVVPSSLIHPLTGTLPLGNASRVYSEAGIFSAASTSGFRIATYYPSPSSSEPNEVATVAIAATTEIAAASISLTAVTPGALTSMSQSLLISSGASISRPTTNYDSPSSNTIPSSSTTVPTVNPTTSRIQDPARQSSESQTPHKEGQFLPPSYNPFATAGSVPFGPLTALASGLSSTPTQGVPSTPLSSIVASIFSIVDTVNPTSTFPSSTGPSTQLQTTQPTSSPTSTPLVGPSSNSKEKLTIGLSVCVPLLVALAVFIVVWLRCRYVEKKRADDLEKDVTWLTPRPHTPRIPTRNRTPRKNRARGTKSARSTPSTLARPDPTFMDGLNDVERSMVEDYQKKVAEVNVRRAAHQIKAVATLTSGRDPEKKAQRRSGGPMMQLGLDGASDAQLRCYSSQTFTQHQDSLLNPFTDDNEIGLAVSTPDESNNNIRNALEYFQPTRLSTITDKGSEIEMPEIPAPFRGAGNGPINQGGRMKGRLLERFIMKRKGMMPLNE